MRHICQNGLVWGQVKHNQGKQALKRIRFRLGLQVNRELLPDNMLIDTTKGFVSSNVINHNPRQWERFIIIQPRKD